jgi:hypothetical protein
VAGDGFVKVLVIPEDPTLDPRSRERASRDALRLLRDQAPKLDAGGGRAWAMRELGAGWRGLLQVCPELQELRERIRGWLESRA